MLGAREWEGGVGGEGLSIKAKHVRKCYYVFSLL